MKIYIYINKIFIYLLMQSISFFQFRFPDGTSFFRTKNVVQSNLDIRNFSVSNKKFLISRFDCTTFFVLKNEVPSGNRN